MTIGKDYQTNTSSYIIINISFLFFFLLERSDMTIGEDYQPNTSPNIIMDIADQIRGLTDNRSQLTHSGTGRSEGKTRGLQCWPLIPALQVESTGHHVSDCCLGIETSTCL